MKGFCRIFKCDGKGIFKHISMSHADSNNFVVFSFHCCWIDELGIGHQRQPVNNFTSNLDTYSYNNVRTETNMTSNNNQLEAWANGDVQQQQQQQQLLDSSANASHQPSDSIRSGIAGDSIMANNLSSSDHRNESHPSSSTHFASAFASTSQPNINNAINIADNHRRSNSNNQASSVILNNNHNDNNINASGTATRIRIKFQKFRKFFTKN